MQDLHTPDRPGLASTQVVHRTLRSSRTIPIIRIALLHLGMPLDMDLGMVLGIALDIPTGAGMFRDIEVCRAASQSHV